MVDTNSQLHGAEIPYTHEKWGREDILPATLCKSCSYSSMSTTLASKEFCKTAL